jgi:hypothetical protein
VFTLIKAPPAIGRGVGVEPGDDIAPLISRRSTLLNLNDAGHFDREIVRGPFESKAFKIGSTEIRQPIKRSDRKSLT